MSQRNDSSRRVVTSVETPDGQRCVHLFQRSDSTFGFEEFRRGPEDPEHPDAWTAVANHSARVFPTLPEARAAAAMSVSWLTWSAMS